MSTLASALVPLLQQTAWAVAANPGDVWITAALPDPSGTEADGEYVVLENRTGGNIDVNGWTLDTGGQSDTFATSTNIAASGTLKICSGSLASAPVDCDVNDFTMGLSNSGDTLTLTDDATPTANEIDQVSYTSGQVSTDSEVAFSHASADANITSTLPATATVGQTLDFTTSIDELVDTSELVRVKTTLDDPSQRHDITLKYETSPGSGVFSPLTFDGSGVNYFGPSAGFPIADATTNMKITFNALGTYDSTVEIVKLSDDSTIGTPLNQSIEVVPGEFPSTNEKNKNKQVPGRVGQDAPYVELVNADTDEVELRFVNNAPGGAWFEYRIDNEVLTSGTPHPLNGPDYPYINNDFIYDTKSVSSGTTTTETFEADEKVEVRLALGGERDWDFDWTTFNVAPDTIAPHVEITNKTDLENHYFGDSMSIQGTATDESGVKNVRVILKHKDTGDTYSYHSRDGGPVSYDGTNWSITVNPKAENYEDGEYSGKVKATDNASNTNGNATDDHVSPALVDTTAPEVTINNKSDYENEYFNDGFNMTGTATDPEVNGVASDVKVVRLVLDPKNGGTHYYYSTKNHPDLMSYNPSTNEWTFSGNVQALGIDDGEYVVKVRALDNAGNLTSIYDAARAKPVFVDTTAPDAPVDPQVYLSHTISGTPVVCSATDGPIYTNTDDILVDWSHPNPSDVAYYWFGIDNANKYKEMHKNSRDNPGEFTDGSTAYKVDVTSADNNPHRYLVTAVDAAGNKSTLLKTCPIVLDQNDPNTTITFPQNDGDVLSGNFTIQGEAHDNESGIGYVKIYVNEWDETYSAFQGRAVDGEMAAYNSADGTFTFDVNLPDGFYTVKAQAFDNAGNNKHAPDVDITIDNTEEVLGDSTDTGGMGGGSGSGSGNGGGGDENGFTPAFRTFASSAGNNQNNQNNGNEEEPDGEVKADATNNGNNKNAGEQEKEVITESSNTFSWYWFLLILALAVAGYYAYRNWRLSKDQKD